jgi:predicted carbohydrate-binding protein with CBM5 and CBM33 domain
LRQRRRAALAAIVVTVPALLATFLVAAPAQAHGAMMVPGSRTYLCWKDGLTPQGSIQPTNPACAAAIAQSGTNSMYNWFAVLRSDGAGRMSGFIPDGRLCSGAATVYDFSGFDLARNDWPVTHLTAGATVQMRYNKWAAHPGTFRSYITRDGWNQSRPLAWSDLESTPFDSSTDPPSVGSPGAEASYYYWNARLPSGKSGRHIIYSVWQRSDSNETFYNCSDVVFDGGNGQVTGIRGGTTTPTDPTTPPPGTTTPPPASNLSCSATFRAVNSWSGGFQGEVTVRNTGNSALSGWRVHWTQPSGQRIDSLWSASYTQSGSDIEVRNASWNGSLAPNASTTFGFNSSGGAAPANLGAHCMTP